MPSLNDWRHIVARAVSVGLSVPERNYVFPVYHYYPPKVDQLPCAVLQPGGPGGADYTYEAFGDPDDQNTFCAFMARFTLWFFFAEPNAEDTAYLLDDVIYRLHKGALDVAMSDELNPDGLRLVVRGASQVLEVTYADATFLSTAVDLAVPVT